MVVQPSMHLDIRPKHHHPKPGKNNKENDLPKVYEDIDKKTIRIKFSTAKYKTQ